MTEARFSFVDLLPLARQGDPTAQGEMLDYYAPLLRALAVQKVWSKLQRRVDGDDIVQEVLSKAVANIADFRGRSEGEFVAWLKTILRNTVANAVRDNVADVRDLGQEESLSWRTPRAGATGETPSKVVLRDDQALLIARALDTLSEAQRDAVVMRHLMQMDLAEISERLSRSRSAVAGLIHRGLKAMASQLPNESSIL